MKLVVVERSVNNENLGIKKAKTKFEVPQAENFAEAVTFVGGEAQGLEILNAYFSNRAPSSAIIALSQPKTQAEYDVAMAKALKDAKEWTPSISTGPSKAEVFKGVSNLTLFRSQHPELWNQLSTDEALSIITGETTLETVFKSKGIDLPAAA